MQRYSLIRWHFPECDRHLYFGVDEADTARGQQTVAGEDRKQSDTSKTKDKQPIRRGYCCLCKMRHDNAKRHSDTKEHRALAAKL